MTLSARRILAIEIVALASTATNAILIALFHRFTTSEFRAENFSDPEFWGIVLTLICIAIMVFWPVFSDVEETLHHIVRINFILLAFLVPIIVGLFPLSYDDWYRYTALLAFLMTITTPIWDWVYRRIDSIR